MSSAAACVMDNLQVLRATLVNFYTEINAANAGKVDEFLARYAGRERLLITDIERKYNVSLSKYDPRVARDHATYDSNDQRITNSPAVQTDLDASALSSLFLSAFKRVDPLLAARTPSLPQQASSPLSQQQPPRPPWPHTPTAPHTPSSSQPATLRLPTSPSRSSMVAAHEPERTPCEQQLFKPIHGECSATRHHIEGAEDGNSPTRPSSVLAERDALVRERSQLRAKLEIKERSERGMLRTNASLQRQLEALQRQVLCISDKELMSHKRCEEQAERLRAHEGATASMQHERDAALKARDKCYRQLQEAVRLQQLLRAQLENLMAESARFCPHTPPIPQSSNDQVSALQELTSVCCAESSGEGGSGIAGDGGVSNDGVGCRRDDCEGCAVYDSENIRSSENGGGGSDRSTCDGDGRSTRQGTATNPWRAGQLIDSDDSACLKTALRASRHELAAAVRGRAEAEALLSQEVRENERLQCALDDALVRLDTQTKGREDLQRALSSAEEEVGLKVRQIDALEDQVSRQQASCESLRTQLNEALSQVESSESTRRELERFCQRFRADVQRAATERVNQAISLSAMTMEDVLTRQSTVLSMHKELQDKQTQGLKDEVLRLSRLLFECGRDKAFGDQQVESLKHELVAAAERIVDLQDRAGLLDAEPCC